MKWEFLTKRIVLPIWWRWIFSGIHTYQKGYFDYRQHGFGPITTEEENLLNELEKILINQGKPVEPYKKRIEETFAFRDSHNCQRVFDAIINLDLEYDENNKDPELAIKYAMNASEHQNWRLAESRWTYIKNILNLSNILIEEKLQEAINYNFQEDIYNCQKYLEWWWLCKRNYFIWSFLAFKIPY